MPEIIVFKVLRVSSLTKKIRNQNRSDFLYQARCTQNFKYAFLLLVVITLFFVCFVATGLLRKNNAVGADRNRTK